MIRRSCRRTAEPARYWLVWVTELEPDGETWQAAVTDLRFLPRDHRDTVPPRTLATPATPS